MTSSKWGLGVWDTDGNVILDISDRIGRFLGVISPQGAISGNIQHPDIGTGTPFYVFVPGSDYSNVPCYVTFNGNSLSWYYDKAKYPDLSSFGDNTTGVISKSDTIYYGVF